ncbi:hypothetical protein [Amycolatopsis sp. cmx-4-61]|uniref:hypothetical protein n=1 Tax=Amycolatopsis sp. cmx-4-61 TaxID=2790937 RepID=UPI00397B2A6E
MLETLTPRATDDHPVRPARASTVWVVELDYGRTELRARLLPGVRELDGLALSHLDVDASGRNGFVLYANFKEADVGEETRGPTSTASRRPGSPSTTRG